MRRLVLFAALATASAAQPARFAHPGILQTRADLDFMKAKVLAGEQPWKRAWDNLLAQPYSSLDFQPKPVTHIARGSFGRASRGDRDLSAGANAAYSHALQWYVTGDAAHARKAIEVIDAWSKTLWDFEGNDAKLLAGWTGGAFCNAAEILRAGNSGWSAAGIEQFRRMLLTVYYPLIRDFFPEANGNWDAAMIDTMLSIGVFCDDRAIFHRAVEHFLRGSGNGGITKYIYPNGQNDENARDQGHSQLGLGYFARAALVASNQGVDLWSVADYRLARGFEYTARYMLGEEVEAYGAVSLVGRGRFSDIYEAVYQHYHFSAGLEMPYTARAVERARETGWTALVMHRGAKSPAPPKRTLGAAKALAGALEQATAAPPAGARFVNAGESIQSAVDAVAAAGGGWVVLGKGLHTISESVRLPSGITLAGEGRETVLYFDPKARFENAAIAIVNATPDLHDVTLRDFVIEGSTLPRPPTDPNQDHRTRSYQSAPSRGGIAFAGDRAGETRNLRFEHLTVRNCTHNGVAIRGAAQVAVIASDFSDNGSSVVPGPRLEHNLLLTRVAGAEVRDSRFDDSPWGSGIDVTFSRDVTIDGNELARNAAHGVRIADSRNVQVTDSLIEGDDGDGIRVERLFDAPAEIRIRGNTSRNNGGRGISGAAAQSNTIEANGR